MTVTTQQIRSSRAGWRFDPSPGRVRYSERWLGALAGGGAVATLALANGGAPIAAALGLIGAAGAVYAVFHEPRHPRFEQITLQFAHLPSALDGLQIAHVSDMHLGMPFTAENTRWAIDQVIAHRPDMLVLTGDFVSFASAIPSLPQILAPLQAWQPPLGIFAVPGNHDYWEGFADVQHALEPLGVEFLLNAHRRLHYRQAELVIAGVDDMWESMSDIAAALHGAPDGAFTLLLAHCPDVADTAAAHGVDLQLSGHTHGGHVCLPGLGSLCLPRYGWRYAVGHHRVGAMQLYVSRGIGGLPFRLGCPPEATLITLRRSP